MGYSLKNFSFGKFHMSPTSLARTHSASPAAGGWEMRSFGGLTAPDQVGVALCWTLRAARLSGLKQVTRPSGLIQQAFILSQIIAKNTIYLCAFTFYPETL